MSEAMKAWTREITDAEWDRIFNQRDRKNSARNRRRAAARGPEPTQMELSYGSAPNNSDVSSDLQVREK